MRPSQATERTTKLGRVDVHTDPGGALAPWAELEALAPGSLYQTRRWLLPWIATAGRTAGITPLLVVAYRDDLPIAFLPLGIARRNGLTVASFLGAKDSNANMGLFRPGADLTPADLTELFATVAAKTSAKPDLFLLANQPERWEEVGNPIATSFPHQPSPSYCHRADLVLSFDDFLKRHLSADGRKKLRRKEKRLSDIAPVAHMRAKTEQEVARIVAAFLVQKRERLAQMGVTDAFADPSASAFLSAAAREGLGGDDATIELHALTVGERIAAIYGGGTHRGRFHGMINSIDLDPEISRCSPGEVLLAKLVEEKCRAGLRSFDLGIGEARYKGTWCPIAEPLFDTILPVSVKGRAAAFGASLRVRSKRFVKQNDWAWKIVRKLRAR